jgi:hypothetical protein
MIFRFGRTVLFLTLAAMVAVLSGCGGDGGDGVEVVTPPAVDEDVADVDEDVADVDEDVADVDEDAAPVAAPGTAGGSVVPDAVSFAAMGFAGGLTQSTSQPPVYASSEHDTLANLLPGGRTTFAPLSATLALDYGGDNVSQPGNAAAYVKSISSDGAGGFYVTSVIDGVETRVHLAAGTYNQAESGFQTVSAVNNDGYYLSSWTGAFNVDPGGPSATDRTDGSPNYTYFDYGTWIHYGSVEGDVAGAPASLLGGVVYDSWVSYGVRTDPANLPTGTARYEGTMFATWWDAQGDIDYWMKGRYIHGDLSLEASFSTAEADNLGTVTGTIDMLRIPDWSSASGEVEVVDGTITLDQDDMVNEIGLDARFVPTWTATTSNTPDAERTLDEFTGTILGQFYGPAAEEVGGVLSGSRDAAEDGSRPQQLISGGFGAAPPVQQ